MSYKNFDDSEGSQLPFDELALRRIEAGLLTSHDHSVRFLLFASLWTLAVSIVYIVGESRLRGFRIPRRLTLLALFRIPQGRQLVPVQHR